MLAGALEGPKCLPVVSWGWAQLGGHCPSPTQEGMEMFVLMWPFLWEVFGERAQLWE